MENINSTNRDKSETYILPVNDAESLVAAEKLKKLGIKHLLSNQSWGATWENLEESTKETISKNQDDNFIGVGLSGELPADHCYNLESGSESSKESSLELLASTLGFELDRLDRFVIANNKAYIPGMHQLGVDLGMNEEEIAKHISMVNDLEYYAQGVSKETIRMAKEAVKNGFIYDDRLITIDVDDFKAMQAITNELYRLGKYTNMAYNTVFLNTHDAAGRMIAFGKKDGVIRDLYEKYENTGKAWIGGNQDSGFFGIQLGETPEKHKTAKEIVSFLEEKTLGYHRLIEKSDVISTDNYGFNLNIHHINNNQAFYNAIMSAKDENDHSAFLTSYEQDDYKDMELFIVNAGAAGMAIKNDGDIVSVFKNPDMAKKDDIDKINRILLLTAVKNGGLKMDCFDGFLPSLYCRYGFRPVCKLKFNDEYAPEGWNFERDGRPDVVFMASLGDDYDTVVAKNADNEYPAYYDYDNIPYIEEYDEALELVNAQLKSVGKLSE